MRERRLGSADLFPTDHPVQPAHMVGRAEDVERVASALVGGGNVVLAGTGAAVAVLVRPHLIVAIVVLALFAGLWLLRSLTNDQTHADALVRCAVQGVEC
ncbi:MAG: hypothetical protein KY433_08120 [Actinobacteria bacterium]|nr:hypothetical protein [Actinomycetota bacterium]